MTAKDFRAIANQLSLLRRENPERARALADDVRRAIEAGRHSHVHDLGVLNHMRVRDDESGGGIHDHSGPEPLL